MNWFELLLTYAAVVDAVTGTAGVWGPLLLGAASLGWGARRCPAPRHRRVRTRPQRRRGQHGGHRAGPGVTGADTCPDVSADLSPDVSGQHDHDSRS